MEDAHFQICRTHRVFSGRFKPSWGCARDCKNRDAAIASSRNRAQQGQSRRREFLGDLVRAVREGAARFGAVATQNQRHGFIACVRR